MPFLDLMGGDRIAALTLLFAALTVGVAILVGILYLVFARLVRQSEAEAARHDRSVRSGPDPSGLSPGSEPGIPPTDSRRPDLHRSARSVRESRSGM